MCLFITIYLIFSFLSKYISLGSYVVCINTRILIFDINRQQIIDIESHRLKNKTKHILSNKVYFLKINFSNN